MRFSPTLNLNLPSIWIHFPHFHSLNVNKVHLRYVAMPCPMNGSNLSHVILFQISFRIYSEFIRYPLDVHGTSNPLLTESAQFADALNVSSRYADRFTTFFPVTFSSFFLIRFSHLFFLLWNSFIIFSDSSKNSFKIYLCKNPFSS